MTTATLEHPLPRLAAPPRRRRRSRTRRAVGAIAVLLVVTAAAAAVYMLTLPSVAGAPGRVRAALAAAGEPARLAPVPLRLGEAIVATEDAHLYDGVLPNVGEGLARAAAAAVSGGHGSPGGSTIDQQLAKELYGGGSGGVTAKLRDLAIGLKLGFRYSPTELLRLYANLNDYGNGYVGLAAAARGYFGVAPDDLSWAQAAMLAGLPQAPSDYDPLLHPALARQRERQVLARLVDTHVLSRARAAQAARARLSLR